MYILKPYDELLTEILEHGVRKKSRTGIDTLTIFGCQKRYRIDTHFPLLTKRKVWHKSIFAELIWMLSGSTNVKDLQAIGSNIWTAWRDAEFEKKHNYDEGALGPLYGFQMRYFGGYYTTCDKSNYGLNGFDQISYIVDELKNNPDSRRILYSLWNPLQMHKMRLPPCHITFQLFVHDGKLSGHLTQRSADVPIGVNANIAWYSAFLYMLAQQTGYTPYEFIHTTADTHIYVNQIDAVKQYLDRSQVDSPTLKLKKAKDIFSYKVDDFEIIDYNPQPKIHIPVAI